MADIWERPELEDVEPANVAIAPWTQDVRVMTR
jgi:hypothetical protein